MGEESHRVTLNVYDLSQGLARQLSATFLGKAVEGIWHTGVVVYGNEYYFGGGIQHAPAGSTPYGTPVRAIELGETHIPQEMFESYLEEISPRYTVETYSLLTHNCNNFSNEIAQFLVGTSIPEYILKLPSEVLNSPMGAFILPMIQQLEATLRSGAVPQAPQFRPTTSSQPTQSTQQARKPEPERTKKTAEPSTEKKTGPNSVPPAVDPAGAHENKPVPGDPLGNARSKVQEEITREFAAIMATGTLRASEAAALATRRVMERYGGTAMSQS